ncbi:MAG: hypothetical protein JJT81_02160 [Rubellimicrobium sp.]|nr:hypothetical protein [Rubellimicrobium sp.]
MTRHIIDRPAERDTLARTRAFLRIDRESGLHPSVRRLHAQRQPARGPARLASFLRIERGRTA